MFSSDSLSQSVAEAAPFKKGDSALRVARHYHQAKKGHVYTVKECDSDTVTFEEIRGRYSVESFILANKDSCLSVATTDSQEVSNSVEEEGCMSDFKVGDRVRRTASWKYANIGAQGTVLAVNPSGSLKIQMDNGHITPNGSSKKFALVNPRNNAVGGDNMKGLKISIDQFTRINGVEVNDNYTDDMLFSDISNGEKEIKRLEAIENKPKALEARIAELRAGVKALGEIVDSRHPELADDTEEASS